MVERWHHVVTARGTEDGLVVVGPHEGLEVDSLQERFPRLVVVPSPEDTGYGDALLQALPHCTQHLLAHVTADYPYSPGDLPKLLARLDQSCDVYGEEKFPDAAVGCRTGRATPGFWRAVGQGYRLFCRVALGASVDPIPGWLGWNHHWRSWVAWLTMGVPLSDPHCGLKVFRRALFDRFPIQSHGDFAHVEIFAKLTFLTCLVAEEPLSPSPAAIPRVRWSGFWHVFQHPVFHNPLSEPSPAALG